MTPGLFALRFLSFWSFSSQSPGLMHQNLTILGHLHLQVPLDVAGLGAHRYDLKDTRTTLFDILGPTAIEQTKTRNAIGSDISPTEGATKRLREAPVQTSKALKRELSR